MLTRSGAKLLDFGLARQGESGPPTTTAEDATATLATEAQPLTHVGTLVGTWPYLAPEQAQGRPADARSDIFALGCVLFEALAGRRAFPGATRAEITAAILGAEPPDLREAVPGVPAALAALVRQCLAKDPDARWQCADDVARGLCLVEESLARTVAEPPARRSASRWPLAAGLLALAGAGVAAALLLTRRTPAAAPAALLGGAPARGAPAAADPGNSLRGSLPTAVGSHSVPARAAVEPLDLVGRGRTGAPARGDGQRHLALLLSRREGDRLLRGRRPATRPG